MDAATATVNPSVPAVIDFEALLRPISEEAPSGENLQYSGVYDEIREARRADDTLSQGSWQRELKIADWRKVVALATSALETQTKDLQIGAWFGEALVKQHGFAGLRDSLKLMLGFHEQFWETIFPEIDEGNDLEARANALEFFDRQTAYALKEAGITGVENFSYFQWEESKAFDIPDNLDALEYNDQQKYAALQQQATEEKRVTGARWRAAKGASNRAFYEGIFQTLEEASSEFAALDRMIDDKFGNQTPGLNQLKASLDAVRDLVKKLLLEKRELEPDPIDVSLGDEIGGENGSVAGAATNGTGVRAVAGATGAIVSRQDALKRLADVAQFFRQNEPHSPVSYLIQRAVKWGNMPLETWLQDVVKDDSVLTGIRETLGFNTGVEEESS